MQERGDREIAYSCFCETFARHRKEMPRIESQGTPGFRGRSWNFPIRQQNRIPQRCDDHARFVRRGSLECLRIRHPFLYHAVRSGSVLNMRRTFTTSKSAKAGTLSEIVRPRQKHPDRTARKIQVPGWTCTACREGRHYCVSLKCSCNRKGCNQ